MVITKRHISYAEIQEGVTIERDDFGLAAGLTETRKKTFFANPNLNDYSQSLLNLVIVDNVVAGRSMTFETSVKIGDVSYPALSGSTLDVPEKFRHLGIGADLMCYSVNETKYEYILASGISEIALPLYKVLRFKILEFPRMMLLCNSRCIIESKGLHGILLTMFSTLVNFPLKAYLACIRNKAKRLQKKFEVRKETTVPEWVDNMTLNDGHKYMEVHDHKWLQWNLDYNFKGDSEDIESFYAIYHEGKPIGFFMTKERFRKDAGGKLKNIILGAVVEWAIEKDCQILNESLLYKMALTTFSSKIDIIEIATEDEIVCSQMKKWGFIKHGYAHIAFKDRRKNCPDASNIKLWRIRYGYADVLLT